MSNTSISIQEPAPPARATRWSLSETNPAERYRSAFPSILSDSVPGENASAPLIGDTPADIITAGSNLVCRMQTPAKTAASTAREQAAIALSPGPGLLALECCMPEWVAMPSNALRTYRLPAAETPHGLPKGLHKLAMQRLPPRARWPGSSPRGRGAARPRHPRRP